MARKVEVEVVDRCKPEAVGLAKGVVEDLPLLEVSRFISRCHKKVQHA